MTDRQFQLARDGQRFRLKKTRAEATRPGPGKVLMRVHAAAINRRDIMILKGEGYPVGDANHFVPLSDAAGEIVELGENVFDVAVGDRVCSTFFQNWPAGRITAAALSSALGAGGVGVLADQVVLSATGVAPMPAGWSYEAAATLPCAGVTAWSALVSHGQVEPDDWVLILGTGGVALFGLQIAAAKGARTMVISSSDEKLERARALGASATINYRTRPDWDIAAQEITGGVHHVLELGGAGTLRRSLGSLAPGGHVALVGGLDGFGGDITAAGMIMGVQRISAIAVGSRLDQIALVDFIREHNLQPQIDAIFPLEDSEGAYARADGGAFGKVVISLAR